MVVGHKLYTVGGLQSTIVSWVYKKFYWDCGRRVATSTTHKAMRNHIFKNLIFTSLS
jgi:hypothetical protein